MASNSFMKELVLDVSSMLFVAQLEESLMKPCVRADYIADLDELKKRFRKQ